MNITQKEELAYIRGNYLQFLEDIKQAVESMVPQQYLDTACLSIETKCDYGSDYGCVEISWQRPETPQEQVTREANDRKRIKYREQQYLILKKEFE